MKRLLLLFTFAGLTAQTTPRTGLLTDLTPKKGVFHTTDPKLAEFKRKIEEEKKDIQAKLIEKVPFWLDLPDDLKNTVATYVLLDYLKKLQQQEEWPFEMERLPKEKFISKIKVVFDFIKQYPNDIEWSLLIDEMFTIPFLYQVPYDQRDIYQQLAQEFKAPRYKHIYHYFIKKIDYAYQKSIEYAKFMQSAEAFYQKNKSLIVSNSSSSEAQQWKEILSEGKLENYSSMFVLLDIPHIGILAKPPYGNLQLFVGHHGSLPSLVSACALV